MDAERLQDGVLKGLEAGGLEGFGFKVTRDGDVHYGAGGDVGGKEDGWEFDLGELSVLVRDGGELQHGRVIATYQALVLGEKDGDTGVDFANG